MNMDLSHYVYFAAEVDTADLLAAWKWLVPATYTPVMITKFGDWFFRTEKNRLVFLDLLEGALFDLGDFADAGLGTEGFFDTYRSQLSVDWIDICLERGLVTEPGQCYGWVLHPMIGGKFEFNNIKEYTLRVYEWIIGQLLPQVMSGKRITGFTMKGMEKSAWEEPLEGS